MDPPLYVGLSAVIIQDGNYGDFKVGQKVSFALEFEPREDMQLSLKRPPATEHLMGNRYRLRGRIVFLAPNAWVIDTGSFLAFEKGKPPAGATIGAWADAEVYLRIDPYFYFEGLHRVAGMPPLTYTWHVRRIMREKSPMALA